MNLDLSKIKKVFFIGIGGIGISALAKMVLSRGMEVSGVNDDAGPNPLTPLTEAGATISFLKDYKDLPEADLYVYSDAWLYRGPEIIEEAKKTGKPVLNYFGALGEFAKEYKVIAIAGTHGKTTTTAMVADILTEAGLDPTVIVGSFIKKFNSNFRKGDSEYLVVEADEYNRHFLSLHPFLSIVLNIEADHLDYYKDFDDVQNAFNQFLAQSENKILDYSKYLEKVPKLSVPGEHNRLDAAAAFAVADFLKIREEIIKKSLAEFSGTWRRLEKRGETKEGTIIYDDYAHHPTEIRASLQGLRELYPKGEKNIVVLFQPHLYSRTKALFSDFAKSFRDTDKVLLLPIYFAREDKDPSISSEKLAEAIVQEGEQAEAYSSFALAEEAVQALKLGSKDIFVTMGAGEAYKIADKVFNLTQ
jgi:UDP-N-acetylmuramate--alanine ligase